MRTLRVVLTFLLLLPAWASKDVQLAAAANLSPALPELVAAFVRRHPDLKVGVTYGASGQLAEQIRRGAPFDVFLSASPVYLERVGAERLRAHKAFARGRLVLYLPDRTGLEPRGLEVLTDPRIRRIALANPDHAPFGEAAVAALRAAGVYAAVERKLIFAANVSQAAQMAVQGADAGLVALSAALHPSLSGRGRYWPVPSRLHPPLEQVAGLLSDGAAARAFFDFLTSPEAAQILVRHGFEAP